MLKYFTRRYTAYLSVVSFALAARANAGLVNFEYTVDDVSGDGSEYVYDFQFWIDVDDPEYVSTLGFSSINVNVSEGRGQRPFGNNFITEVSPGFVADDVTGLPNFSRISVDAPGFNYWQPNSDDFLVAFSGRSTVLADMTWNYFGRTDINDNTTGISGAGVFEFLTATPVNSLTDFDPAPEMEMPSGTVAAPESLALFCAGLFGFAATRRRLKADQTLAFPA